jgi:hypothetical protein
VLIKQQQQQKRNSTCILSAHNEIKLKSTAKETTENVQTHKLDSTLLNKLGNKNFQESNENENTTYHNLRNRAKSTEYMLRGKFIAMSTDIKTN